MMRALLVLALVGCGDGTEWVGAECAPRDGMYRSEVTRLSGQCSDLGGGTFDPNDEALPETCLSRSPEPTSCETAYDVTCTEHGRTVTTKGGVRWSRDGLSAQGVIEVTAAGCVSTWRVTYTKIE